MHFPKTDAQDQISDPGKDSMVFGRPGSLTAERFRGGVPSTGLVCDSVVGSRDKVNGPT